ncbi:uncharacterized mitochondrial protein AtMg00810-like [Impatiens glandulifera]|uniref:uncharacterized mitochondrial protein AtMg00810-like n=1 Tax=Impatiens glandulifera TaxID=253017 RepID=UPI001FB11D0B|nr:uncharacterized mitochondrial protein AtMg00810-like [Impatiens glandulifera]
MEFKASMMREFDMTDLGCMSYLLGIEVLQKKEGIFICQRRYAEEVLKRFGMLESNLVSNPTTPGLKIHNDAERVPVDETYYKQIVGSLMYLTSTRLDLMYVTSLLSRVLRYLKGTMNLRIFYKKGERESTKKGKGNQPEELEAYTDSDYAGDSDNRKSTSGYAFLLSSGAVGSLEFEETTYCDTM